MGVLHPSVPLEPTWLYLTDVNLDETLDKRVPLKSIVDLKSIRRLNKIGTYFVDRLHVFIYRGDISQAYKPFVALENKNIEFFGYQNIYLKTHNAVYCAGIPLEDLDYPSSKYLKLKSPELEHPIDMIKDKNSLYIGQAKLTFDQLCNYTDYPDSVKNLIIKDYLGLKTKSVKGCKPVE